MPLARAFWAAIALLVYTHAGYPVVLRLLARRRRRRQTLEGTEGTVPTVPTCR